MRILLATALPHFPQGVGGSQSSTHQLANMFLASGHTVAVACGLWRGGFTPVRSRLNMLVRRSPLSREKWGDYTVFRTASVASNAGRICREFEPDVVLVQALDPVLIGAAFLEQGVRTILYIRDVEEKSLGGDPRSLKGAGFVANSNFTAGWLRENFGLSSRVIPPYVEPALYRVSSTRENVTFINPSPVKGLALALAIADQLPQIRFQFVESWALPRAERKALLEEIARRKNITFRPRRMDMRAVYRRAKIVLVPSQWKEAWGRVVSEAHVSGIPVVAANIGGLPESTGPGGVLLDPSAPAADWAAEIKRLWTDEEHYQQTSQAALHYSQRAELDLAHQSLLWKEIVSQPLTAKSARRAVSRAAPDHPRAAHRRRFENRDQTY
jgi:glycosyltransferase involved in cell wall biosynthesis